MLTAEIKSRIVTEAERHERMDGACFQRGAYESRNGIVKHCSIGCVRAAIGLKASVGDHGELVDPTGVLGNGVPLPMGRAIAKAVKEAISAVPG